MDSTLEKYPASWRNTGAAIAFLHTLSLNGPWTLTAIYSDDIPRVAGDYGPAPTQTFSDHDAMQSWIAARNGHANLYYTPNRLRSPAAKKPGKQDVAVVAFFHVDIDDGADGKPLISQERKAQVIEKLCACDQPGPPSFIVD